MSHVRICFREMLLRAGLASHHRCLKESFYAHAFNFPCPPHGPRLLPEACFLHFCCARHFCKWLALDASRAGLAVQVASQRVDRCQDPLGHFAFTANVLLGSPFEQMCCRREESPPPPPKVKSAMASHSRHAHTHVHMHWAAPVYVYLSSLPSVRLLWAFVQDARETLGRHTGDTRGTHGGHCKKWACVHSRICVNLISLTAAGLYHYLQCPPCVPRVSPVCLPSVSRASRTKGRSRRTEGRPDKCTYITLRQTSTFEHVCSV